jgi:hypothetical protein
MPQPNQRIFGPQHWNAIAKDLREEYNFVCTKEHTNHDVILIRLRQIEHVALRFAMRFNIDSQDFDPLKWLDQCSPDTDMYPFSELWEEANDDPC